MMGPRPALACLAAAAHLACACALPPTDEVHGEHLDYAWEPALTPCAGTIPSMDAFIPFAAAELGLRPEDLPRVTYTWLSEDAYYAQSPDDDFVHTGNFRLAHAYGAAPAILHELAHAIDDGARSGRRFFIEGLAEALTPSLRGGPRYHVADPRPFLTATMADDLDAIAGLYGTGGAFVAYLLAVHGPAPFLDLHRRLGPASTESRIRRVFADVYGNDLDAEVELFLGDACPAGATAVPQPYACAAPTLPWRTPTEFFDTRAIACDDPVTVGGHGDAYASATVAVTLDVPEDGAYELRALGDRDTRAILASCGPCPWLAHDTAIEPTPAIAHLRAGRHALVYTGDARALALAGAQIVRSPTFDE